MTSLYSARLDAHLHLGKLPASIPSSDHVRMVDLLRDASSSLPRLPKNFGHGLAFGKTGWGMMGNGPCDPATTTIPVGYAARDGAGDCVYAGNAHDIRQDAKVNRNPVPNITDYTAIKWYAAGTGYDPQTGSGDNGTDPQQALSDRQTKGLADDDGKVHKIGQVVSLTPGNLNELYYAAYLFEKCGVGFQFQSAQMNQFDAGQPWSYVNGSPIEGGHWVIVESRNGLITWGERIGYAPNWYAMLNDESYAWVSLEQYNTVTGESAEHWTQTDLSKYITLVAQAKSAGPLRRGLHSIGAAWNKL